LILRILFDQNIPPVVCEFVRKQKPHWELRHVYDVGLQGATDQAIFEWAQSDLSIVVTYDEDFADFANVSGGLSRRRDSPASLANHHREHGNSHGALF